MLHTLAGGAFCTHGTAAMAKVYPWACMSKPTMASSATLAVSAAHLRQAQHLGEEALADVEPVDLGLGVEVLAESARDDPGAAAEVEHAQGTVWGDLGQIGRDHGLEARVLPALLQALDDRVEDLGIELVGRLVGVGHAASLRPLARACREVRAL